jgi:hypothetical protein
MSAMMGYVGLTETLIEGSAAVKHRNFPKTPGCETADELSNAEVSEKIRNIVEDETFRGQSAPIELHASR